MVPASSTPIETILPHLALVDRETWKQAQPPGQGHVRPLPQGGRQPNYLLSGLLLCPLCGCTLVVANGWKSQSGRTTRYYRCQRACKNRSCGWTHGINAHGAEESLLRALAEHFMQDREGLFREVRASFARAANQPRSANEASRQEILQLRAQLAALAKSLARLPEGPASEAVLSEMNDLQRQCLSRERELEAQSTTEPVILSDSQIEDALRVMPAVLATGDAVPRAREILRSLFPERLRIEPIAWIDETKKAARSGWNLVGTLSAANAVAAFVGRTAGDNIGCGGGI